MDDKQTEITPRPVPFNNLYLLAGLVNGNNKLWMYVFTILLLILGYISFQITALYPLIELLREKGYSEIDITENPTLLFNSEVLGVSINLILLIELGMFAFAFMGFIIGLKKFHQKTLLSVLSGYEKFRMKRFVFAFLIWGGLLILSTIVAYMMGSGELIFNVNWSGLLVSALIMVLLMPFQTGIEEIVFRGYLLQGLAQLFKNGWVPLILTSLLFALAHMTNPEVKQYGWPMMFLYYCCFALFMGIITLLDEGLELAFGIHFANNFISSVLVNTPNSAIKTYSLFDAKSGSVQSEMLLWCVFATLTFFIFWKRYKWKNFNLIFK